MTSRTRPDRPPGEEAIAADREIDVQHGPIGAGPGYSGQEYDANHHAADAALAAAPRPSMPRPDDDPALPPDNGRRATIDPDSGAVHGSGVGAGGGQPGEDFDSDSASGDGFPYTGKGS